MKLELNIKTVDEKNKSQSTLVIDLLKKFEVPGGQAVKIFRSHRSEYIVRKCFLLEYHLLNKNPITKVDAKKWIQAAIRNDYNESDAFLNWYKAKKEYILNNGNGDLKQLVSI
jgi:hypothetical protein